eukprot:TRINITY_DN6137_c0_g3_i1.p1 TRINITY_DN6137_c0_g3~~TRINITY_DN6137_c0_g3_i1.p1  ORF type:complete len:241 (+),score=11.81 TRINITY_DN6137_c0_g3_i1:107-829(+)
MGVNGNIKLIFMKILDEYNLKARVFPVLIAAFPIILFLQEQFMGEMNSLIELLKFEVLGGTSFLLILLWFISMLNREISKAMEKYYYGEPRVFPSTYLMLYTNNVLSEEMKNTYRAKVTLLFKREAPLKELELENLEEAIKHLGEIAQLVLDSCRDDVLLFKHNIWYGFWRNLISAILILFPFVLAIVIYDFYRSDLPIIQLGFLIVMSVIILLHKRIWKVNAERFAKKLFSIFLTTKSI